MAYKGDPSHPTHDLVVDSGYYKNRYGDVSVDGNLSISGTSSSYVPCMNTTNTIDSANTYPWRILTNPTPYSISGFDISSTGENPLALTSPVRSLYAVYVVDPESGKILLDGVRVIATSEDNAKLKAMRNIPDDVDYDDLDIRVILIMNLRDKKNEKKE